MHKLIYWKIGGIVQFNSTKKTEIEEINVRRLGMKNRNQIIQNMKPCSNEA